MIQYKKTNGLDRRVLISIIWIFTLINMIYADILGMMKPGYLEQLDKMSKELSSEMVLIFSVLMEVPILMILLSRILPYKTNRWVNFIGAPLSILWVVVPALMPSLGTTPMSYVFFASVEVMAMLSIVWLAWKWPNPSPISA